ncbi:MAG: tRNA 5-methoxyuridine(34)/uridine 5-oxyacetic acid(34) synthase CmoB [Woeseiaceae bacterium]|nr:tRNA 5-methoxyuridine(34)/uridine 5-oxyacetic acid(34) synthase CmoB [Woeseiaceae bacterium]
MTGERASIDREALASCLANLGLDAWIEPLAGLIDSRLSARAHGDFARWQAALDRIAQYAGDEADGLEEALKELSPWRKGPFDIGGIHIDSEWRSDLKWSRLADAIAPLAGRHVLDVGSGNGYYALQMQAAGAATVIGVDPTLLYVMQFIAVRQFQRDERVFVVPARLHELPLPAKRFDTTFSMGVLYHQRSPIDHLRQLRDTLKPGGQLVLETIFVPGDESFACTPADRYARMKNVWLLPTIAELATWLKRTGYSDVEIVDTSLTTTDEQRATEWMTFESLAEALDPNDPSKTVEGWPAPRRVVVTATSP